MHGPPHVLILCTGNSARSQMAEALLRSMAPDRFVVHSAGLQPAERVHPLALAVLEEAGVPTDGLRPKPVKEFLGREAFRHIVFVCSDADNACPRIFPGMVRETHWAFEDPARAEGSEEERLAVFRRVRDEIRDALGAWIAERDAEAAARA